MKHLEKLLIFLILYSCTNKNLIVETGEINNGVYINNTIGVSIDYRQEKRSPWTKDSLNRVISFERIAKGTINLNNQTEAFLIGFHDKARNTDLLLSVLNNNKIPLSKVKEYIISKNKENVQRRGVKLKVTSSKIENITVNDIKYEYFNATYMIQGKNFMQKSQYAYKEYKDFILLIEYPLTVGNKISSNESSNNKELIEFINTISFIH